MDRWGKGWQSGGAFCISARAEKSGETKNQLEVDLLVPGISTLAYYFWLPWETAQSNKI